jgi:hypothetical protein
MDQIFNDLLKHDKDKFKRGMKLLRKTFGDDIFHDSFGDMFDGEDMFEEDEDEETEETSGTEGIEEIKGTEGMEHQEPAMQNTPVQAKSEISQPGDAGELQADKVAEAVTKGDSQSSQLAMNEKVADIAPKGGDGSLTTNPEFDSQLQSSKGQGQKLDENVKGEMEGHLGADLSNVNIHTNEKANELSENINAKAFTHGQDVYFKDGNYDPASSEGKQLLAHELTHTQQQGEGTVKPMIQRTEVDTAATPKELKDSESLIDEHVNKVINDARTNIIKDENNHEQKRDFISEVFHGLGKLDDIMEYQSKIEVWIEKLGKDYVYLPKKSDTKYAGVDVMFWKIFKVLGYSMKVAGVDIGSDKLGHFFQQGYDYFEQIYNIHKVREEKPTLDQESVVNSYKKLNELGYVYEKGKMGKSTTGVFSFADIEANIKGYQFYLDLFRNPNLKFSIRNYMRDMEQIKDGKEHEGKAPKSNWSEEQNTNAYRLDVAEPVWKFLLSTEWRASDEGKKTRNGLVDLKVGTTMSGTLYFTSNESNTALNRSIKNGIIEYTKIKLNINGADVEQDNLYGGITINCLWKQGDKTGNAIFKSINEQTLNVTFKDDVGNDFDSWVLNRKK